LILSLFLCFYNMNEFIRGMFEPGNPPMLRDTLLGVGPSPNLAMKDRFKMPLEVYAVSGG